MYLHLTKNNLKNINIKSKITQSLSKNINKAYSLLQPFNSFSKYFSTKTNSFYNMQKFKFSGDLSAGVKNMENQELNNVKTPEQIMKEIDPLKTRNIAIIAHVDHGKTTLVDCMLSQGGGINITNNERAMDSNELEQERGITILSKATAISYNGMKINIVDTPGHQDFGGEVERIMTMVDSVCLVVCACEGPMPQTRYVLQKALSYGIKPIVVINKSDREAARLTDVENEIFDLFISLDATEEQLEYPLIYASAKNGWASFDPPTKENPVPSGNVFPLMDTIINSCPSPKVSNLNDDFKMLITQIESNNFFGKMLIGKIESGIIEVGSKVSAVDQNGEIVENGKIFKIIKRIGTSQIELQKAGAGDVVLISGFNTATVSHTLNVQGKKEVIKSVPIDPPMISVLLSPNDSPYYGKDGDKFTYQQIKDRLIKESENDVSLRVEFGQKSKDSIQVFGRGDLHLGILIEKLRREGFEMTLNPPQVLFKYDENKVKLEPIEAVTIEFHEQFLDILIELTMPRFGELVRSTDLNDNRIRVEVEIPTRGMFGLRSKLINITKGHVIIQSKLKGYEPFKGPIQRVTKGAIISMVKGKCTTYALKDAENHGDLYVVPGSEVYEGQVIGEMNKEGGEVELSPCREKQLSNVRTTSKDENIKLAPVKTFTIEDCMVLLRGDEVLEVTPKNLRIRKKVLDNAHRRKLRRENRLETQDL